MQKGSGKKYIRKAFDTSSWTDVRWENIMIKKEECIADLKVCYVFFVGKYNQNLVDIFKIVRIMRL